MRASCQTCGRRRVDSKVSSGQLRKEFGELGIEVRVITCESRYVIKGRQLLLPQTEGIEAVLNSDRSSTLAHKERCETTAFQLTKVGPNRNQNRGIRSNLECRSHGLAEKSVFNFVSEHKLTDRGFLFVDILADPLDVSPNALLNTLGAVLQLQSQLRHEICKTKARECRVVSLGQ